MKRITLGLFALLTTVSCGGVDAAPNSQPATVSSDSSASLAMVEAAATEAVKAPAVKASIKGMIKFEGAAPEQKVIDMAAEASCHKAGSERAGGPIKEEYIVVNDGGLANVVISISKGIKGKFEGTGSVDLRQEGCQYIPHVLALQAGQSINIINDDGVVHNVHSYSKRNTAFNMAQPAGAPAIVKDMKRKDKMFPVKCDMHAWMNCQVVVFDHPYFTVSGENGAFEMGDLPAGKYTITAEHEKLGSQTAKVTVGDSGSQELNFTFKK
ncbi:MAG: plastocyanin [Planctomycetota bacterium]|jgi:plastocyanin